MGSLLDSGPTTYLTAPYEDHSKQFIKSFSLSEKKEISTFFQKYGFVAVRDVLSQ